MNEKIEKLDEKFIAKIEYEQELQEPEEMRIITRNALHARDTALVRAIAEAVEKELPEIELGADGTYEATYYAEIDGRNRARNKAIEVINSFAQDKKEE
jgi:uncharacterized protein (DUF2267 family)